MKPKHLLLLHLMLLLSITAIAQNAVSKKYSPKDMIPFGKKLPPPDPATYPQRLTQQMASRGRNNSFISNINPLDKDALKKTLDDYRQQLQDRSKQSLSIRPEGVNADERHRNHNSNFHLTRDINPLAESFPANNSDFNVKNSYAILDHVIYFAADDGIHGNELWRSDGTAEGTYILMDIEPGAASSGPYNITAVNGKLYFSAATANYGYEPWVSDGTPGGTHLLMDIVSGTTSSYPTEFIGMGKSIYFVTDGDFSTWGAIWKTDGTAAGTERVESIGDKDAGGYYTTQLTVSNGLLYFTFYSFSTGTWELWRSDGTDAGTYNVGPENAVGPIGQLTNYNGKLYFSADDGTGLKLWISDGTVGGTAYAPNNNNVILEEVNDFGVTFPVLNNVLYIAGASQPDGAALYKYDPANTAGLVKVKQLSQPSDGDFIMTSEMVVANNTLYFVVTSYSGSAFSIHDKLWSSRGSDASTQLVTKLPSGQTISGLYNGNGALYFIKDDPTLGTELWSVFNTFFGAFPIPVSDIFRGSAGSYPNYLTAFKGKLFFSATDEKKGTELFMTNDFGFGAALVKDINTTATSSSFAGYSSTLITSFGCDVLFDARDNAHGYELYKSDGTERGTYLLNDIARGDKGSIPQSFITKGNSSYFIAFNTDTSYSIYKTNGTKPGLQKITPDYDYYHFYFIINFDITDNGLLFYVLYNINTGNYELWRSNGTIAGTFILSSTVYSQSGLHVVGNVAFFDAGDARNGYELWKSDGSIKGTGLVKDINPGVGDAFPGGLFVYKNQVYFGAYDGVNHAFWKSDGTEAGTVRLKNIDAWWGINARITAQLFCISNNILYFSALQYADGKGTELWKTDGTPAGTQFVKDVNPLSSDIIVGPYYLTDVHGTLFFTADDGEHGNELWKSDGTEKGTQLVKDITPGIDPSNLFSLVSYAGKLYFINNDILWSSDGTEDGTIPVDDPVISDVEVSNIIAACDKLFVAGYTHQYGAELYAGKVNDQTGKLVMLASANEKPGISSLPFNAVIYPNPSISNTTLQITGNTKNVSVSITDMSGRKLWESNNSNATFVNLPTAKFAKGTYVVTVRSDMGSKIIKIVKQ